MSKKTRGSARTRQRRPGARPASSRQNGRQPDVARPESQAGVAPLNAIAQETPPPRAPRDAERPVTRVAHPRQRAKPGSLLAARAATEYLYVGQDLRRISVVGVLLFGALIVLWLAIVVLRVIPLPFY